MWAIQGSVCFARQLSTNTRPPMGNKIESQSRILQSSYGLVFFCQPQMLSLIWKARNNRKYAIYKLFECKEWVPIIRYWEKYRYMTLSKLIQHLCKNVLLIWMPSTWIKGFNKLNILDQALKLILLPIWYFATNISVLLILFSLFQRHSSLETKLRSKVANFYQIIYENIRDEKSQSCKKALPFIPLFLILFYWYGTWLIDLNLPRCWQQVYYIRLLANGAPYGIRGTVTALVCFKFK